jgi:hypothetical protein
MVKGPDGWPGMLSSGPLHYGEVASLPFAQDLLCQWLH